MDERRIVWSRHCYARAITLSSDRIDQVEVAPTSSTTNKILITGPSHRTAHRPESGSQRETSSMRDERIIVLDLVGVAGRLSA